MPLSRRLFMASGLAGVAGAMASRVAFSKAAVESPPADEDGYKLWLRYAPPGEIAESYRKLIRQVVVPSKTATGRVIGDELRAALKSLLGAQISLDQDGVQTGAVIVGTPKTSDVIGSLNWNDQLTKLGAEGFLIRSTTIANQPVTVVAAADELGAMYGAFHLLGLLQTGRPIDKLDIAQRPKLKLRMVDHWDNPNGTIERGYAGRSLWQWNELPDKLSPRYADYARANASIGLNAVAINNVNADFRILSAEYLHKVAALAEVFRPYGIRLYLVRQLCRSQTFRRSGHGRSAR